MATLPDAVHEQVEYEVLAAWHAGYAAALADVAERADALDLSWRPATRRDPQRVIAERAAALGPAEGVDTWLDRHAEACARHDAAAIEAGRHAEPMNTWAEVRDYVPTAVWARILGDLTPGPKGSRDTAASAAVGGREAA